VKKRQVKTSGKHPVCGLLAFFIFWTIFLILPLAAGAALPVADNATVMEKSPAVAGNTNTGDYLVAYFAEDAGVVNGYKLSVRRFNASGVAQGSVIHPFNLTTINSVIIPQIAFNPETGHFLVAVPVLDADSGTFFVAARFLDGDGSLQGSTYHLFDDGSFAFNADAQSYEQLVQVVCNTLQDEFLVTCSLQHPDAAGCPGSGIRSGFWGQRLSFSGGEIGPVVELASVCGEHTFPHAVAFASLADTVPAGGRYVVVTDIPRLYDSQLVLIGSFEDLDLGNLVTGDGRHLQYDVASGRIGGEERILLVYQRYNCCGSQDCSSDPSLQCMGIWGTFLDPALEPTEPQGVITGANTPFFLSHTGCLVESLSDLWRPRVAYNYFKKTFYVAWIQVPVADCAETVTHVRGRDVRSLDPSSSEFLGSQLVLSDITGSCSSSPCLSDQDPQYPEIAPSRDYGAVVVWQQNNNGAGSNLDIWSSHFSLVEYDNDVYFNPDQLEGASGSVSQTLYGATNDGFSSCTSTTNSPDRWYLFVAPDQGLLRLNTCGSHNLSGLDTVLSFHNPADGVQLPAGPYCNDDYDFGTCPDACGGAAGTNRDSALSIYLEAGSSILVRVSHYGSAAINSLAEGQFMLNYSFMPTAGDGLWGKYYRQAGAESGEIVFQENSLEMERIDPRIEFIDYSWPEYKWEPLLDSGYPDHYGVDWKGYLHVDQAGYYGFGTISDDGSQVFIHDQLVVDNHEIQHFDWEDNISEGSYTGQYPLGDGGTDDHLAGHLYLEKGFHKLEVKFYDDELFDGIVFYWQRPGTENVIPFIGTSYDDSASYFNPATQWEVVPQNVFYSTWLAGDIDGDGDVDGLDLQLFLVDYQTHSGAACLGGCPSDVNGDQLVNQDDVILFADQYGESIW